MARLSDVIEDFIKQILQDAEGVAEIQRNELASQFNCVPSQINYVISTRFTHKRGYYVESRRGGGGFIRISQVNVKDEAGGYLMHIVTSIGDSITQQSAEAFIQNFVGYGIVTEREGELMKAALSDKILMRVGQPERDEMRAMLLKNMLTSLAL